ncbi:MAG: hypothetical protein KF680_05740 [Cryobacterium sp.]|nr:hypothetical protein [Cryobacterium sp.]
MSAPTGAATRGSAQQWSDSAIAHLLDNATCPVCGIGSLQKAHCPHCGADLSGSIGLELWNVSTEAATALKKRETVLARVPRTVSQQAAPLASEPSPATGPSASAAAPLANPRSSATVQSVLATAGAGLFAISAIVFTFFNPELSDRVLRSVIIGLVTLVFLGGAWWLARRRLQFSAEAVGALGMVFVALDVYAIAETTPASLSPWLYAAVGTLVSAAVMATLSVLVRIRTWLWTSLLGLAAVPAMLGYAGGTVLAATYGHLGTAFAGLALIELTRAVAQRFDGRLRVDTVTITVVQIVAVVTALTQLPGVAFGTATESWLGICTILAATSVLGVFAARNPARGLWSFLAGAAGVAAVAGLPFALDLSAQGWWEWYFPLSAAAGAAALLVLGSLIPTPASIDRLWFSAGTIGLAVISVVATAVGALQIGAAQVLGSLSGFDLVGRALGTDHVVAVGVGLAAAATGFGAFAVTALRRSAPRTPGAAGSGAFALWLAATAGLVFACVPTLPRWGQIAIPLALAFVMSAALARAPRMRAARFRLRLPLLMGAHVAVLLAVIVSWSDPQLTVWAGTAIVVALIGIAWPLPARSRFLHVGAAYAYALIVVATALGQLGVGPIALLCLTTSFGLIGALVATVTTRLRSADWHAILAVTSVPFVIGVVKVVFERSGWTALSTGIMFLLALTLLVSRRQGLGIVLRAIAAGLLVPSLAVVIVCLGAEVLAMSASPVTLPIIAAIVALTLPSTGAIRSALERRGIGERHVAVARVSLEASALLTGAIAVALALVRVAAGLPTTALVLVILALGAAAASLWARRRYGWWLAAACLTGALWCVWALAGIGAVEPYLLPPAIAAAVVGFILTLRGTQGVPLYASGLVLAIVPLLVVLAVSGSEGAATPWRGYGLIAASWALLGLGGLLGRSSATPLAERFRMLRTSTLQVAIVAGAAGAIQGVRLGIGADTIVVGDVPLVVLCLGIGLAGALPAAVAARLLSHDVTESAAGHGGSGLASRWLYAPTALYVGVATWPAIERDWLTVWVMWALMLAYLVAVVLVALRLRRGRASLPPVWFLFALAFATAIVAWSPRDLRVEVFSMPLGLFLLLAGVVALRGARAGTRDDEPGAPPASIDSWPARWRGSWPLLAPGLGVMLLASIVATFTDPQTWRAILVIVIALVAILAGASLKLAAPFLMGVVVLPVENFFVFVVQIGRGIESMPWWITLAVVGAVLLIIAVTYERRAGEESSIAARLRDLA